MRNRILVTPFLVAALAACGGGGGNTAEATAPATAPAATEATVASIVPGASMGWATASERTLTLALEGADGKPAANAGVRVFTLSRSSPQDGAPLEMPVPMSLLDSAVSDDTGRVALTLKWPGHVGEVLVVATLDDAQGQRVIALDAGPETLVVALSR
jgi:hypothetical protein